MSSVPDMSNTVSTTLAKTPGAAELGAMDSPQVFDLNIEERNEVSDNSLNMETFFNDYLEKYGTFSSPEEKVAYVSKKLMSESERKGPEMGIKRCKNVFLDFGSNIGDSIGKFIDASFLTSLEDSEGVRYDVTNNNFYFGKYNQISKTLKQIADSSGSKVSSFCAYGVEGNPTFTERLKNMEKSIMSLSPRPVQNLHMLTEHVGMGEDGPTKLFLDTTNVEENFWGSSVLESHQDVQKSETITSAPVTGITLTTLMDQTLLAFSSHALPSEKEGGRLIVKIDIEGGEYKLMEEVSESLKLCEYKAMGNEVDLIVEYHYMSITAVSERRPLLSNKDAVKQKLEECGVKIQRMSSMWH